MKNKKILFSSRRVQNLAFVLGGFIPSAVIVMIYWYMGLLTQQGPGPKQLILFYAVLVLCTASVSIGVCREFYDYNNKFFSFSRRK